MRKVVVLLIFNLLITGCTIFQKTTEDNGIKYSEIDYNEIYFDTYISFQIWDEKKYNEDSPLWKGAEDIMKDIQYTFQRTAPSELYDLNQTAGTNQTFALSDDLFEVMKIAMDIAEKTEGELDPTVGPLIDLWDINARTGTEAEPPTKAQIDALLPLVGYQKIQFDKINKTVLLPQEGMILEFGAISKGYAADKLAAYFKNNGIEHAILNLGGNVYVIGERYAQRSDGSYNWAVGIREPDSCVTCAIANVYLTDTSVVTSGIYERYIIDPDDPNKIYHHILDPQTGYPYENNLSSVTIISKSSALADALSTSVFALGIEEGINFIETNYPEVEAVFIDKEQNIYKTDGVDSKYKFELLDE